MKIGCPKGGQGGGKVCQTEPRGTLQQTKSARDLLPSGSRGGNAGALIDKDKIRAYRSPQRDGLTFPRVEKPEAGVLNGRGGHDSGPCGQGFSPEAYRGGGMGMTKFSLHDLWIEHGFEQPGEDFNRANQQQVT